MARRFNAGGDAARDNGRATLPRGRAVRALQGMRGKDSARLRACPTPANRQIGPTFRRPYDLGYLRDKTSAQPLGYSQMFSRT